MRNFVTTLVFAGASLLGTIGIVTYADPAVAATPLTAVHGRPIVVVAKAEAYAAAQRPLAQQAARIAAR